MSQSSRREFLRRSFLMTVLPATYAAACADDTEADLPELPVYDYTGTPGPEAMFEHGVASGDPKADSVILWTRVSTGAADPAEVFYEVAEDAEFTRRLDAGYIQTDDLADFTVKLDVEGLAPGATYYFRFFCLGRTSPVGRTRTLPAVGATEASAAVVSCSSYAHGYFHSYRRLVERDDVDVVIHLGDYIYEYGDGEYGNIRTYDPPHEILTLDDYRRRYRHYRLDADLQAAHAKFPFIAVWDDHESADNSWSGGAENHEEDGSEGAWEDRKAAARQAYAEWLPIREQSDGRIYRSFAFGDLFDLIMLDTRIWGREEQRNGGEGATPIAGRQLLGADQEAWLGEQLAASTALWRVIGQQVMMGHWHGVPPANGEPADGAIFNSDQWDGYESARQRFFGLLKQHAPDNNLVLTGDIHSSWAIDLTESPWDPAAYDPATGEGAIGGEFVTPAISSPGFPEAVGPTFAPAILEDNPHMRWVDLVRRGYLIIRVNRERIRGEWYHFDNIEDPDVANEFFAAAYAIYAGRNRLVVEADSPTLAT